MPLEYAQLLSRGHIPQAHRLIPTAADKLFSSGAEGHRRNPARMTGQAPYFLASDYIPQTYRLIHTGTGDLPAIGAKISS